MWFTNVENISIRSNSFGFGPHFCQQIKHTPLEKMMIRTTCKAVNCSSNVARVKYLIGTSNLHLHLLLFTLVNSVEFSHQPTRAQSEKTIWRVEIILRSIFIKKFADAEIFSWKVKAIRRGLYIYIGV